VQFQHTPTVLPPQELDLCNALTGFGFEHHPPAGLKVSIVFERQFDSNLAVQTLGPRYTRD